MGTPYEARLLRRDTSVRVDEDLRFYFTQNDEVQVILGEHVSDPLTDECLQTLIDRLVGLAADRGIIEACSIRFKNPYL